MSAHSSPTRAARRRHREPYNWLGAGAIAVAIALGATTAGGPAIAYADETADSASSSEGAASAADSDTDTDTGSANATTSDDALDAATPDVTDPEPKATPDDAETPPSSDGATETDDDAAATDVGDDDAPDTTATGTDTTAADEPESQQTPDALTPEQLDSAAGVVVEPELPSVDEAAVAGEVVDPDSTDLVGDSAAFSSRSAGPEAFSTLAVPALPNPLAFIGAAIAYEIKGIQDRMNPLISGALGVWHLQTGINQIKTLHLIGGALNLSLGVLSFATVGLGLVPIIGPTLLVPVTATLATGVATVNTIGSGLLHW